MNFFSSKLSKLSSNTAIHKDEVLCSYNNELNELYMDLQNVYSSYKIYCEKACKSANISVDLYTNNNIDNEYLLCATNIARETIKTFSIQYGNFVLQELKQWILSIKSLINKINNAQNVNDNIYQNNEKLQVLLMKQQQQHDHQGKHDNNNILSEISEIITEKNEERISNLINEKLALIWALNDNLNKLKEDINIKYKEIMDDKYDKFDFIYSQILQSQQFWYNHSSKMLNQHRQSIVNHQHHKLDDDVAENDNNGDDNDDVNIIQTEDLLNITNEPEHVHIHYENMINIDMSDHYNLEDDEEKVNNHKSNDFLDINQSSNSKQDEKIESNIKIENLTSINCDDLLNEYNFDNDDDNNDNQNESLSINCCIAKCFKPKALQTLDNNDCNKVISTEYYLKVGLKCNLNLNTRRSINLVIALDNSLSMNTDNKLQSAKKIIHSIFSKLNNEDKFGFLTFCSSEIKIHFELNAIDLINYNDDDTFIDNYLSNANIDNGDGDKNMENGFANAIDLIYNDEEKENNFTHSRILFITDESPNIQLLQMIINAQTQHNIFTTYYQIDGDQKLKQNV